MVTTEICSPSSSPNVLQCKCCSQKVRLLSVRWSFFKPSTYFLLYGIFGLLGFKNIVFKGYRQRLRKIYRSIRLAFLAITAINTVQVAGGKREKKKSSIWHQPLHIKLEHILCFAGVHLHITASKQANKMHKCVQRYIEVTGKIKP